jgi:hypothetical protein
LDEEELIEILKVNGRDPVPWLEFATDAKEFIRKHPEFQSIILVLKSIHLNLWGVMSPETKVDLVQLIKSFTSLLETDGGKIKKEENTNERF